MVLLITFTIVIAWLIAALFLAGIIFSLAFKNFDIGYAKGLEEGSTTHSAIRSECLKWAYDQGLADRPETVNPFGTILADNADLDEIMVIRYDDQLPHRYKRIID
jgi:hypothetical protein